MDIRPATLADYPNIAEVGTEMGLQHHQAVPKQMTPDPMSEKTFAALLVDPSCQVVVGTEGGEFVGFLYCRIVDQPADEYSYAQRLLYVHEIGVLQRHHRRGYGEALMNYALDAAKAAGVDRVTLRVWSFNEGAIAFYRRFGFAPQSMIMSLDMDR